MFYLLIYTLISICVLPLSMGIIRQPNILCRRSYILPMFFLLLSFFFFLRSIIPEVAERNSTKIGHMVGSTRVIRKRMSEIWDTASPYKSRAQKPPFWTTSQLNGKFNGLYLRNETWCRQSVKCVDNYNGSPTWSQNVMNIGPQTHPNWTAIFTHPM